MDAASQVRGDHECGLGQIDELDLVAAPVSVPRVVRLCGLWHELARHARQWVALGIPSASPATRFLHAEEGKIALPPSFAPALDQCVHYRELMTDAFDARAAFALIPNNASDRVGNDRLDELGVQIANVTGEGRFLRHGFAVRCGLLCCFFPFGKRLRMCLDFLQEGLARLITLQNLLQPGIVE